MKNNDFIGFIAIFKRKNEFYNLCSRSEAVAGNDKNFCESYVKSPLGRTKCRFLDSFPGTASFPENGSGTSFFNKNKRLKKGKYVPGPKISPGTGKPTASRDSRSRSKILLGTKTPRASTDSHSRVTLYYVER